MSIANANGSATSSAFGDVLNPPAYKYTYMTADYVLGSLHGGILEPFQQHTWDVTFVSDKPYNSIFTVHPYHSSRQLGMFFPEELNVLSKDVDRYKVVYTNPDKWNSSSPFEQTFQHRNVLIVLYNIAPGASASSHRRLFPGDTRCPYGRFHGLDLLPGRQYRRCPVSSAAVRMDRRRESTGGCGATGSGTVPWLR